MQKIARRFIEYAKIDTQADDTSTKVPSTSKQLVLLGLLAEQLAEFGISHTYLPKKGMLYGFIPTNLDGDQPTIGLVAHVDTALEMSGADVKPRIIKDYQGEDIVLNKRADIVMKPYDFPALDRVIGQDIIVTDGKTLLGGDDKAGLTIIMEAIEHWVNHPNEKHVNIAIAFTCDEEIGRGVDQFDLKHFPADFAYTIDGSDIEFVSYENFNAASAEVRIKGKAIHPGDAKDKMVNALRVAMEFLHKLPEDDIPERTSGYQGFNHITELEGGVEEAVMHFIIRNHDSRMLTKQKKDFERIAANLNYQYGEGTITLSITDSYQNMGPLISEDPTALNRLEAVFEQLGLPLTYMPIRGGTDGARLSFMGVLTPNIGTGGYNAHGKYEFVSINQMEQMVKVVVALMANQ